MSSVNKVILVGRVGADPDVKNFSNGGRVVNLRIATSETWKDKNSGEKRERTEWHSVTIAAEGLCKIAESYVRKGARIYVEGQLQTRKWQDQNGQDRWTTEIVLKPYKGELVLLDSPGESGQPRPQGGAPANYSNPVDDLGDEIPFFAEWR